ncbi:fungal-specific transcription factor domain-containing protein [Suillus subaureus]|uniref:Fungal-specific transcription factor domain-containing protein n=1 Tax=Suillus subaureus TaxID=48587 RepID=A0A9P7EAK9_9AGAM|nr:fungal-specific transcription factor domain-containing protein [Suillus subaureus]KAG1815464.1 fungal-specific transcription factor domain-containing protein [Suillus subaureus]
MVKNTSASETSSLKRRKTEEDDGDHIQVKKPRSRVSFSCGECHRRKQKCDRQIPCSHCVARKVPELCKAYTPGKTDQDLSVRLARLEHIIEQALPQYFNSPSQSSYSAADRHQSSTSDGPDDDSRSITDEQDPSGGTFHSGKWFGNSASGSVAPASVLEQLANVVVASSIQEQWDSHHSTSNVNAGPSGQHGTGHGEHKSTLATPSIIESVRQDSEPSAADNLKSLVQECGVSPHKISELLQELPPQRFSDVLIDHYFAAINWTRYPVCEADFRTAYASLCVNGVGANTNDARFLPLLFVVLAISVRLAPEHLAGDARTRRVTSLRYYWSSRRSLLIAAAIQPDSLDIVLTRLLSARFLTFDRRITECWSQLGAAVRTAQALGFHRDAAPSGLDPAQVENRRRIWSYLYHADRSYALVLGRPHAIQDDYTCTLPPLNIDDDFSPAAIRNPPPLSSPTLMTFVILRHQLASIIGRMVHHFQKVKSPSHYSDVLALDDDLLKFVTNLPPHFSLDPDTSLDETKKFIPVHRFLLITEVLFVRVGLHRPYLLRKLSCDRYLRSRKACFESSIKDFQVRKAFRDSMPKETRDSLSNAYREFQTAMISGIYLVLHPKGKDADMMHTILDGFLADHEGVREMDETTRRELKTIEFLKSRASQMAESASHGVDGASSPTNGHTGEQHSTIFSMPTSRSALPPSTRQALTMGTTSPNTLSPTMSSPAVYALSPPYTHSPAMQRLQHSGSTDGTGTLGSPAGSGSPSGEEESAAQSLLDHWCSTFGGSPAVDATAGMPALSWGGPGGTEFSGWIGPNTNPMAGDPGLMEVDGSDWSYWEALVNQIKAGPQL